MYAKTVWYSLTLIVVLLHVQSLHAQPITHSYNATAVPAPPPPAVWRTMSTEICGNNIDDDGNGLTDENDFNCYFPAPFSINCNATKIVWATDSKGGVYWGNLATGEQRQVVTGTGNAFLDLTWAADGKLYAIGGAPSGIWEIDPNTGALRFRGPNSFGYSNSLTADGAGNLYFDVYDVKNTEIIKLNIATWQACTIATLQNQTSGGDLTFLNGDLYLSCSSGDVAKINIKNGEYQTFSVAGGWGWFGLTTIGDGDFYASFINDIYRVDTKTNTKISTPVFTFKNVEDIYGLATYAEICQAPKCLAQASISTTSTEPYCSSTGVSLIANVTECNKGIGSYQWTSPSGNTATGYAIQGMEPGMYYLNYQMPAGTCKSIDSFYVQFQSLPAIKLGNDTSVCEDDDVYLKLTDTTGVTHYSWQDGSTQSFLVAPGPGLYWVDAGNKCGSRRDSIIISAKTSGCERSIVVPSAFSPNGDGRNDTFKPIVKGNFAKFEFTVYNRWGQIIFKTNEINRGWDGLVNESAQSAGLFIWVCRYQVKRKEARTIKGTVTLIR